MIELRNLNKSYCDAIALKNITLSIKKEEIFGIIGKSGAGKTSLLKSINLLERPDSGQVLIDGQDLMSLSHHELALARHRIGMIFQQFNLLESKNIEDNIALPLRIQGISQKIIQKKIDELLDVVELSDKRLAYPHQLSGGQKQRVAIARALSASPDILLCDEATSALDPQTTASILDLLKKINKRYGITIVLITHEMEVIKRVCHRLAVIVEGSIVETTSLSAAFQRKDSLARHMLFDQFSPQLPECVRACLTSKPTNKPLLRILFQGHESTVPFISQTSRTLNIDINILLANIDCFDTLTCGILVVELTASPALLQSFLEHCQRADLTVEILGYAEHDGI